MTDPSRPLLAMKRDASWYDRPRAVSDQSSRPDWIGKYHIADCHNFAMCSGAPLAEFTAILAEEVASRGRCMRSGCRVRWPEAAP
jgi:hypothetical protein